MSSSTFCLKVNSAIHTLAVCSVRGCSNTDKSAHFGKRLIRDQSDTADEAWFMSLKDYFLAPELGRPLCSTWHLWNVPLVGLTAGFPPVLWVAFLGFLCMAHFHTCLSKRMMFFVNMFKVLSPFSFHTPPADLIHFPGCHCELQSYAISIFLWPTLIEKTQVKQVVSCIHAHSKGSSFHSTIIC